MDEANTALSIASGASALGARFKAGLKSVLGGYGKTTSPNSSTPMEPSMTTNVSHKIAKAIALTNGHNNYSSNSFNLNIMSDELLGEPENGEDESTEFCDDDDLLEGR